MHARTMHHLYAQQRVRRASTQPVILMREAKMPTLRVESTGTEAGGRHHVRKEDDFDRLHRRMQRLRLGQKKPHRRTGLTPEVRQTLRSVTRPRRSGDPIQLTSTHGLRPMNGTERAMFRMHWRTPLTVERA